MRKKKILEPYYCLSIISLIANIALAEFSGTIVPSDYLISQTGVTYTFSLSYNEPITETDSKIVVRFPADFVDAFTSPTCTAVSGFTSTGALTCSYNSDVRILTISSGFPAPPVGTIATEMEFQVAGITNPRYAATTQTFTINSYKKDGSVYNTEETSDGNLQITFTPGALSGETLALSDQVVGAYSLLTVGLTTVHAIPQTGQIQIDFPKWNNFDGVSVSQYEPYVATSTSPGSVPCNAVSGIPVSSGTSLNCIFEHNTNEGTEDAKDTLYVNFDGLLTGDVPIGSILLQVDGVRSPPTTNSVSGFSFKTATAQGELIDQSTDPSTITLQVTTPALAQSANMEVLSGDNIYPDDYQINKFTSLTFKVKTVNPLQLGSTIEFTIPSEFSVTDTSGASTVTSVSTLGARALNPSVALNWSESTRTLRVEQFNAEYIPAYTNIYIEVSSVTNPGQTSATGSFSFRLYDPDGFEIEYADTGITFTPTAGSFQTISVTPNTSTINAMGVSYRFTMRPSDTFDSTANIKITLPPQISIENEGYITAADDLIDLTLFKSSRDVQFNRIIYLRQLFPAGMSTIETFSFTIQGFTNPTTTQTTDAFDVVIYYTENSNEVTHSTTSNTGLMVTATPSLTALTMAASLTELETGQVQTAITITGVIQRDNPIEKQSYLRVKIPSDFTVTNENRVASTCTRISGFSDEISCSFENAGVNSKYLIVQGGFDSRIFTETRFSFSIAEVQNPTTTKRSDGFELEIYDKDDGLLYQAVNDVTFMLRPSDFSYVYVESKDDTAGATSIFVVTLTLGVDTPQSAMLEFNPPDDVVFVNDGAFVCRGTQNLSENLYCSSNSDKVRKINLVSDNEFDRSSHPSGTTIQFEIGYLKNPLSLQSSGFFYISTIDTSTGLKYIYNESINQVKVTNTQPGSITITEIIQSNQELEAETGLQVSFETSSPIPSSSTMIVTLPQNTDVRSGNSMKINGKTVQPQVNNAAKQFIVEGLPVSDQTSFEIDIPSGIFNPSTGPYSYDYLQIEFQNTKGYSIDKITMKDEKFVEVKCTNDCDACSGQLSFCTSCGQDFFLKGSECLQDCGTGYFQDSGYLCSPCDSKCLDCTISATACTLCNPLETKPYAYPTTYECFDECPTGTYLDAESTLCITCESPCYTCSSKDICLSCDRTNPANLEIYFFEAQNKCYSECPNTSVPTPSKLCEACESPCETCEKLTKNCLTCIAGFYLHTNNECITSCPFLYYEDDEARTCTYFGELGVPVPFSIIVFIFTVGVGISSFIKGTDSQGRQQEGTAFFVTMLALVDILLRINWAYLAYNVFQKDYYRTFGCLVGLLAFSFFINLFLWRRYFYSKYQYEDEDPMFSAYVAKYPWTAYVIIFLSYVFSFQAIRLTYSRFLNKKMFMAGFSRRLRYFRLIGRLTVFEIILVYLPAVSINIYSLTYITDNKEMQYWLNIDSLALVSYALLLILVVLTQREKLMNFKSYFKFSELFKFGNDQDDEEFDPTYDARMGVAGQFAGGMASYDDRQEWLGGAATGAYSKQSLAESGKGKKGIEEDELIEVQSAYGYDQMLQKKMYQIEQRQNAAGEFWSEQRVAAGGRLYQDSAAYGEQDMYYKDELLKRKGSDFRNHAGMGSHQQRDGIDQLSKSDVVQKLLRESIHNGSVIDIDEYRRLQDKQDRINLKKALYERKKINDETQAVLLNEELTKQMQTKDDLNEKLIALKKQLKALQRKIVNADKNHRKELVEAEQVKRRAIIHRAGREVPYQSHSGVTSHSRSRSQLTKSNVSQLSKSPRDMMMPSKGGGKKRRQRGGQKNQQGRKSPRIEMNSVPLNSSDTDLLRQQKQEHGLALITDQPMDGQNSSMMLVQSPNIFHTGLQNITEPISVPEGEHRKPPNKLGTTSKRGAVDAMDQSTEKQSLRRPFRQEQLSTQVADNLRRPSIAKPGPDTETQKDEYLQSPQIFARPHQLRTTPDHLKASITEATERVDNLQRPIDTLRTDEVDNRVEDAVLTPENPPRSGSPIPGLQGSAGDSPKNNAADGGNRKTSSVAAVQLESFGAPAQTYPFDKEGGSEGQGHDTYW